jgi:hypothetical protein
MGVAVNVIFVVLPAAGKLAPTVQPVPPGALSPTRARWTRFRSSESGRLAVPAVTLEAVNVWAVPSQVPPTAWYVPVPPHDPAEMGA